MKYAVLAISGHQYKVSEGDEILVDKQEVAPEAQVLLIVDGEKVLVGDPIVKGAKVGLEVMGQEKGDKISVFKYKAKSRYRKKTGFRSKLTRIKIKDINP